MGPAIDHVVYAVADLEQAAETLRSRFGLESVAGGRHLGWGTGNRIVPLGDAYLELLSVVDHQEAALDPFGQRVAGHLAGGDRPFLWVVRTDDLDGVAGRLGLAVDEKSRLLPGGGTLAWRSAGLSVAAEKPWLPFFIAWQAPPEAHPGRMAAEHPAGEVSGIAWVAVGTEGEEQRAELATWLAAADGDALPVRYEGPTGVNALAIAAPGGEIVVR